MTILLFKALLRRCDSFGLKSILACPLALLLAGAIAKSMPLDGEIPAVLPLLFNEGETDYLPDAERQQNAQTDYRDIAHVFLLVVLSRQTE